MIPTRLIRCVPQIVPTVFEEYWQQWMSLHRRWDLITVRDPIEPSEWPLTGHLFSQCTHGAQVAGLVRLEAVWRWGGIYCDMDFEPRGALDKLCDLDCFIGTQDGAYLTDAIFGASAKHPAIKACIDRVLTLDMSDGPLVTGPGNTTEVLSSRDDVTIVPPHVFYPYLWFEEPKTYPETLAVHHWNGSWLHQ